MLRGKGVCGEDPTSNHLIYPSVAAKPMLPPWGFSEHATGYISGEFGAIGALERATQAEEFF